MQFNKPVYLGLFVLFSASFLASQVSAQEVRPRRAPDAASAAANKVQTTVQQYQRNAPTQTVIVPSAARGVVSSAAMSRPVGSSARPTLTNDILVRPTVTERAVTSNSTTSKTLNAASLGSMAAFRGKLFQAMNTWYGTPYHYGSEGPNSIDCSALVWRVFAQAGINFERTSARTYWNEFAPATEAEKTQFGTLVFFNQLGHVGIVIDENTFFHASSSKGVTFSSLDGYWSKRIVGYRRVPLAQITQIQQSMQ